MFFVCAECLLFSPTTHAVWRHTFTMYTLLGVSKMPSAPSVPGRHACNTHPAVFSSSYIPTPTLPSTSGYRLAFLQASPKLLVHIPLTHTPLIRTHSSHEDRIRTSMHHCSKSSTNPIIKSMPSAIQHLGSTPAAGPMAPKPILKQIHKGKLSHF